MAECSRGDPKLAKLVEILEAHFERAAASGLHESRAMVFTSKRNGVEVICELAAKLASGLIRARCGATLTAVVGVDCASQCMGVQRQQACCKQACVSIKMHGGIGWRPQWSHG